MNEQQSVTDLTLLPQIVTTSSGISADKKDTIEKVLKIQIKKFKKIDDVTVILNPINIFIGTNNSGKSSFIQGIQFAISACQTLKLNGAIWKRDDSQTLSLDSNEYLYTPTNSIEYLYHGKRLTGSRRREDRIGLNLCLLVIKKHRLKFLG